MGKDLVVTNGDQTDTIVEKGDFVAGCMAREYEPDKPNYTPRASSFGTAFRWLRFSSPSSSARVTDAAPTSSSRTRAPMADAATSSAPAQGERQPASQLCGVSPSTWEWGAPEEVWAALNPDNKVSLYTNVEGEVPPSSTRTSVTRAGERAHAAYLSCELKQRFGELAAGKTCRAPAGPRRLPPPDVVATLLGLLVCHG